MEIFERISQGILALFGLIVIYKFIRSIRIVPYAYEYIVERLGKYNRTLSAGFHALIPFLEKVAYIQDLKEQTLIVPPQECFTKDNVKVLVGGVLYISVTDSYKASYGVTDFITAATVLVQTTTRSVIGIMELDRTFEERDLINDKVSTVVSEVEKIWGIKVHRYEVKEIDPPSSVRNAMERQMTAERQRRAIIAESEGIKQSMINDSEGQKREIINVSEGEMRRRVNEAEGYASEIESIARATAESISKIATAISLPSGEDALKLRLAQKYFTRLKELAKTETNIILPADLTKMESMLDSIGLKISGSS
jgi:regulator of protease activity HflC (stomatin/prohibitin superfamily)